MVLQEYATFADLASTAERWSKQPKRADGRNFPCRLSEYPRHQRHRSVPLHTTRVQNHARAITTRRPDYQQRLNLGFHSKAILSPVYTYETCHQWVDQIDGIGRSSLQHCLFRVGHWQRRVVDGFQGQSRQPAT